MKSRKFSVILFFLFLIIPTVSYGLLYSRLDHENHENRAYAEFPSWRETGYSGMAAGLEAFYNDRVPYKNQLKGLRTQIDTKLQAYESKYAWTTLTPIALQGKDGWAFYMPGAEGEDAVRDYQGINRYTDEELERYAAKFQQLSDYYAEQGIEFVYLVVPGKESVYTEYMPDYYPDRTEITRSEQFVAYLRQHTTVKAVYPLEEMRENTGVCDLYYKMDSHWNMAGAYVGAKSVMDLLQEGAMPPLEEVQPQAGGKSAGGDLSNILGITGPAAEEDMIELQNYRKHIEVHQLTEQYSTSDAEDGRKMMILGDSFGWRLFKVLERMFGEVKFTTGTADIKDCVNSADWKPDIIVWETAERYNDRIDWPDILMNAELQDQGAEGSIAK